MGHGKVVSSLFDQFIYDMKRNTGYNAIIKNQPENVCRIQNRQVMKVNKRMAVVVLTDSTSYLGKEIRKELNINLNP